MANVSYDVNQDQWSFASGGVITAVQSGMKYQVHIPQGRSGEYIVEQAKNIWVLTPTSLRLHATMTFALPYNQPTLCPFLVVSSVPTQATCPHQSCRSWLILKKGINPLAGIPIEGLDNCPTCQGVLWVTITNTGAGTSLAVK